MRQQRLARTEAERLSRMKEESSQRFMSYMPLNAILRWSTLMRRMEPGIRSCQRARNH